MENELTHKGHRQRMRAKLSRVGPKAFDTYELLEMLLDYSIPRQDTKPLAKRLLSEFGSLEGIFSATREELLCVPGVGEMTADLICAVSAFTDISEPDAEVVPFSDYGMVGEFFVRHFKEKYPEEHTNAICAAFLDNSLGLIAVEDLYELDLASGAVHSEPFIRAALNHGTSVCIVAHTHPHGFVAPTNGDYETAKMLKSDFANVGMLLLECYVVSYDRFFGFMTHSGAHYSQIAKIAEFIRSKEAFVRG